MSCRYDRETDDYLTTDGEPCRRDDYGDPTHHCTARRTCAQHIGRHEQTCARCIGRTRQDIRQTTQLAALMLPEALVKGVNSEAANLAGPAADPEAWSWRKVAAMQGRAWHLSMVEDDDDWHPFTVLTRWAWLLSGAYSGPTPDVWNITNAGDYLEAVLHRVAQDDDQDYAELAREIRKCRSHLEAVLANSHQPERGAPCPDCKADGTFVRLVREYPHWCDDPACCRVHDDTEASDVWQCPRRPDHKWSPTAYRNYLTERQGA